jgi:small subunit ribosomal protein S18
MARGNDRDRGRRAPRDDRRRSGKKKVCIFCAEHLPWVDYKEVNLLRRFMSDRGKIRARRVTGNCAQHQREVAVAIKTARELALLPYTQRTVTERSGGRGGGRGGPPRDRRDQALAEPTEATVEEVATEPEPEEPVAAAVDVAAAAAEEA